MKKFLCALLSLLLLSSLGFGAFAEDAGENWIDVDCSAAGVTLMIPESMVFASQGEVDTLASEELGYKSGVYYTYLGYIAAPYDDYINGNDPEDDFAPLLQVIALRDNYDSNAFAANNLDVDLNRATSLGNIDDLNFYVIIGTDSLPAGFRSPYTEEYEAYLQRVPEIINNSYFYEPEDQFAGSAGNPVEFQTTDLYGNTVDSASLFAENEITMVNLWATWCPHCCEELPQLAQIHEQLQALDCGIVGMLEDGDDPEAVQEAIGLLADAGADYPCVVSPENRDDIISTSGLPLSFFVNRNGEMVGSPIDGAQVDKYYEAVVDLLNGGIESDIVTDAPGAAPIVPVYDAPSIPGFGTTMGAANLGGVKAGVPVASGTEYRVICVDEAGNPVAGAAVQFCSDITCMMAKTDENGVAVFDVDPGHYTVHLLKPPAGYAKDSTEYEAPATFGDVTIVVKAG